MDPDYVDVPADRISVMCSTCGGLGVLFRPFTPAIPDAHSADTQADPCPDCEQREAAPSSGRVSLGAGPGAQLRRVDRVAFPWDGWG